MQFLSCLTRPADRRKLLGPNIAAAALISIDGMVAQDWDAAIEAVDVVDKWPGGDPSLDKLRAISLLGKGELDEAQAHKQ